MFYCGSCAKKKNWPSTISRSRGRCEVCGDEAVCNDMPSSKLPEASPNDEPTITLRDDDPPPEAA